jgi:hypothetical protein
VDVVVVGIEQVSLKKISIPGTASKVVPKSPRTDPGHVPFKVILEPSLGSGPPAEEGQAQFWAGGNVSTSTISPVLCVDAKQRE